MKMSHHTIAIEIFRCVERVLKGTLILSDPFLPEKKRTSPKPPITGQKDISYDMQLGKGTKRINKLRQLLSDKVKSFI